VLRNDDDFGFWQHLLDLRSKFDAVGVGERHVHQHQPRAALAALFQRLRAVGGLQDGDARVRGLHVFVQHPPHEILVLDDQHSEFSSHV